MQIPLKRQGQKIGKTQEVLGVFLQTKHLRLQPPPRILWRQLKLALHTQPPKLVMVLRPNTVGESLFGFLIIPTGMEP